MEAGFPSWGFWECWWSYLSPAGCSSRRVPHRHRLRPSRSTLLPALPFLSRKPARRLCQARKIQNRSSEPREIRLPPRRTNQPKVAPVHITELRAAFGNTAPAIALTRLISGDTCQTVIVCFLGGYEVISHFCIRNSGDSLKVHTSIGCADWCDTSSRGGHSLSSRQPISQPAFGFLGFRLIEFRYQT